MKINLQCMKIIVLVITLLIDGFTIAQNSEHKKIINSTNLNLGFTTKSNEFYEQCLGETEKKSCDLKWLPILTIKSHRPESENDEQLEELKEEKLKNKFSSKKTSIEPYIKSTTPMVGRNWLGNINSGSSPMDNNIAISNNGIIVSVANSTIEIDDENGNLLYYNDLVSFFNDAIIQEVCDPVVLYDNQADRFILFFQESSGLASKSKLCICFSKSNNPANDGWWKYKFSGNPLNDNSWFDYPKMAVSDNELYITGNLFYESGGFNQAILYQFNKNKGYDGISVNWQFWHNISGNPFTLMPVGNGQGMPFGPGCYLLSTTSSGSSNINLYDLTDDMTGNPVLNHYSISTTSYSPAANSAQLESSDFLDNGDCRVLSGFYLNGIIHFVFHSDIGNGWNGLNYNRLDLSAMTNQSKTFGLVGQFDYSYPSVCSISNSPNDKSVLIGFGRSGSTIYPEIRVVNCDDAMNWSSSTLVKTSESYVNFNSGTIERWGDYTGMTRKHNASSPTAWMNGMFGNTTNYWDTWISEIGVNATNGIQNNEIVLNQVKLYPNPVIESMNVEFNLNKNENISIDIIDLNGKKVMELLNRHTLSGEYVFSFNKANLNPGTYYISIRSQNQLVKNEKIIVID